MARPVVRVRRSIWRVAGGEVCSERAIPEETAIAFTFNTASYAVMMATPQDLEDFAVGFSLTEGVISSVDAVESIEVVEDDVGIELRIWLKAPHAAEFLGRRRKMAGPTGCGLCGIESLVEAMRPPPKVHDGAIYARYRSWKRSTRSSLCSYLIRRPVRYTPQVFGTQQVAWLPCARRLVVTMR